MGPCVLMVQTCTVGTGPNYRITPLPPCSRVTCRNKIQHKHNTQFESPSQSTATPMTMVTSHPSPRHRHSYSTPSRWGLTPTQELLSDNSYTPLLDFPFGSVFVPPRASSGSDEVHTRWRTSPGGGAPFPGDVTSRAWATGAGAAEPGRGHRPP